MNDPSTPKPNEASRLSSTATGTLSPSSPPGRSMGRWQVETASATKKRRAEGREDTANGVRPYGVAAREIVIMRRWAVPSGLPTHGHNHGFGRRLVEA